MKLTPAQAVIASDKHRFRVVNSGRRFGKTELAAWEMKAYAVFGTDRRIAYIAPTFQQARDIAWQTLKRICLDAIVNVNESRLELTLKNVKGGTSTIWLRGWEAIETLRGQRFDFIVIDEVAMMKNFWGNWQEVIRPTLTDTVGQGLFISTPKGFNHWYDLYNLQSKDSDYKSFHYTSYDNPHVPATELDKAKGELTEDRFAQEYLADFRKTEGLVYKEFDRHVHVFDDKEIIKAIVMRHVGIDWGFTNPCAVLEIIEDRDRNFYVVSEYYQTSKTTEEILAHASTLGGNDFFPDPAEPDRIEEMRRKKMNVREVNKDVTAGIDSVRRLLKNKKLFIHSSCFNLIWELETYSYKDGKQGLNTPEEPIKENDHACDALRYVLHMVSNKPSQRPAAAQFIPNHAARTATSKQFIPRW